MCLDSISFMEKIKHKIIMSYNIIGPSPKKSVSPSEKDAPSEELGKISGVFG